jgi:hypothetical protein
MLVMSGPRLQSMWLPSFPVTVHGDRSGEVAMAFADNLALGLHTTGHGPDGKRIEGASAVMSNYAILIQNSIGKTRKGRSAAAPPFLSARTNPGFERNPAPKRFEQLSERQNLTMRMGVHR